MNVIALATLLLGFKDSLTCAALLLRFKDSFANEERRPDMNLNNDVINELKFIGQVKKGEKIHVKSRCVQPDGISTKISRTIISPDCRNNTLKFIDDTISRSFDILDKYISSNEITKQMMCINMVKDLSNSKLGIENLKSTYSEDRMFCCTIDGLVERIDAKLESLKDRYKILTKKRRESEHDSDDEKEEVNLNSI